MELIKNDYCEENMPELSHMCADTETELRQSLHYSTPPSCVFEMRVVNYLYQRADERKNINSEMYFTLVHNSDIGDCELCTTRAYYVVATHSLRLRVARMELNACMAFHNQIIKRLG